jgi:hypothetical protein
MRSMLVIAASAHHSRPRTEGQHPVHFLTIISNQQNAVRLPKFLFRYYEFRQQALERPVPTDSIDRWRPVSTENTRRALLLFCSLHLASAPNLIRHRLRGGIYDLLTRFSRAKEELPGLVRLVH